MPKERSWDRGWLEEVLSQAVEGAEVSVEMDSERGAYLLAQALGNRKRQQGARVIIRQRGQVVYINAVREGLRDASIRS